ncbi:MAG: Gmad2 immunoglobulin-like domain-containing protein [Trueperaceae bacterium]
MNSRFRKTAISAAVTGLALSIVAVVILSMSHSALSGDVTNAMTLAGGRVSLDAPAKLALAISQEQLLESSSPPPCAEGFTYCFYPPTGSFENTDFRSAGLGVFRREDLRAEVSCLLAQPDGWSNLQPGIVRRNTSSTSRFGNTGQGAAGSFTSGEVLRLFDGEECWEFEVRVAQTRYENYEPGTIDRFTDEQRIQVEKTLWSILESATLTSGGPVEWPDSGSSDLSAFVRVDLPAVATSPLRITGEAWGPWFFEGSFPVTLDADDGRELAASYVTAQGEWMVEDFVPFEGELEFKVDHPMRANLVLHRDNPSDLREHDAAARFELDLQPEFE